MISRRGAAVSRSVFPAAPTSPLLLGWFCGFRGLKVGEAIAHSPDGPRVNLDSIKASRMSSNKDSRQRFLQRSWRISGAGAESVGLIAVRFGASPGFASNWGVDLGRATPPCCAQVRNRARDVPSASARRLEVASRLFTPLPRLRILHPGAFGLGLSVGCASATRGACHGLQPPVRRGSVAELLPTTTLQFPFDLGSRYRAWTLE